MDSLQRKKIHCWGPEYPPIYVEAVRKCMPRFLDWDNLEREERHSINKGLSKLMIKAASLGSNPELGHETMMVCVY